MKILALETIGVSASAALLEDGVEVQTARLDASQKSAQALVPMVQTLLAQAGWTPQDIGLVAIAEGPGSFTGLRVGITFAKTFAYTVNAVVIGVPTLEVLAAGTPAECSPLSAAMDAQRGDVVVQDFAFSDGGWTATSDCRMVPFEDWLAQLPAGTYLNSAILQRKAKLIADELQPYCVSAEYREPNPVVIGQLAWKRFQAGQSDGLWNLLPVYSRLAAAEERKKQRSEK